MNLVVDAAAILGQLLSRRVPRLLNHPELNLFVAERVLDEADSNLERRAQAMVVQQRLTVAEGQALVVSGRAVLASAFTVVAELVYAAKETEAQLRLEPHCRDRDWPSVALTLLLGGESAGIWTEDRDFWGCGCPVWSTAVLGRVLMSGALRAIEQPDAQGQAEQEP